MVVVCVVRKREESVSLRDVRLIDGDASDSVDRSR